MSPGTAVTGFPPGTVSDGSIHAGDAAAGLAKDDLVTAYNDAAGRTVTQNLSTQDLGGMVLTTGVYKFDSEAQLTGTLTLDAENDPEAVFIFQITSALTTASGSTVRLINGARFCRVFWQVGSSATLGTNSVFVGHIFALTSISAQSGAKIEGQLLARNGAVTLDNNVITNGDCETTTTTTTTTTTASETAETTASGTTTAETTASGTTAETTASGTTAETTLGPTPTTSPSDDIPTTGESNLYLFIGLIVLGLAGSLTIVRWRMKSC